MDAPLEYLEASARNRIRSRRSTLEAIGTGPEEAGRRIQHLAINRMGLEAVLGMQRDHRDSRRTGHRHKWSIHRQELPDNNLEEEWAHLSLSELSALLSVNPC